MEEFRDVEFVDNNPNPRCACVLLLDNSSSMSGDPIKELNDGLLQLKEALLKDELAQRRAEIAIVTFGDKVRVVNDFVTADTWEPPALEAKGLTPMGAAILKALDLIADRKEYYKANGLLYYRPLVFMITDGEPQGEPEHMVQEATQRLKNDEENKRVALFAIGVENANMVKLSQIVVQKPKKLRGLEFGKLFQWLSDSLGRVARSKTGPKPGDQEPLQFPPTSEWGI